MISIRPLDASDEPSIQQTAQLMVDAFREHWPSAWPTLESGLEEVRASLDEGYISLVARNEAGEIVGWISGEYQYGRVWELLVLAVRVDSQRQGVGRALVETLETLVREQGALTLMLGSDDEDDMTSLSGVDLYEDTWRHVASIRNLRGHPYSFYEKLGYKIVGVVPDANGWGRPDILMAKRLGTDGPQSR